ncbi:PepSY domain-containing protein [Niallia sp. Krafla_26]|uniref:PepSY domain-containing protein n=1 Tax=Niallia sp. Krafla_26 TaxID=3064703 RepID=UPI003D165944
MNWKTFLIGAGAGVVASLLVSTTLNQNGDITPEKALSIAKSAFKKHGPIQGSWIQMKKQPYKKEFLQYDVFVGGISRKVEERLEQYEFIVDSKTGAILDAYPI